MLTAFVLGLLALVVAGEASRLIPCNNWHDRSLLQDLDDPNPAGKTVYFQGVHKQEPRPHDVLLPLCGSSFISNNTI
jgi:hypothetical protein